MIEERYLSATNASNLADVPHRIGQVDLIKASGLSEYSMASVGPIDFMLVAWRAGC